MQNKKREHKEHRVRKTEAEKRTEEIQAGIERILERLEQIEVNELWMKTWRTHRE